jgi:hypothetical protein
MQTDTSLIYLKRIGRILLKVVLFLLLFVVIIFLLLLTPPVQRFATVRVENYLENKLKTKVEIGRIGFNLAGNILLKDIYVEDRAKDTLIAGGSITANLALMKLFSNEVDVRDIHLQDITAKVKRELPDTVFNFQFIVDAFAVEKTKDTSTTALLKLNVDDLTANNFRVLYNDVITGNYMLAHINEFEAKIDTLNPYTPYYDIASLAVNGMNVQFNQRTPLVKPEPLSTKVAEAAEPIAMKLNFGDIVLDKIDFAYNNHISQFFTRFNIGHFAADGRRIDLQNNFIHLDKIHLDDAVSVIRVGKEEEAKKLVEEIGKEAEAQAQNNWSVRVDELKINNNKFQFDNENQKPKSAGTTIDYAHMKAENLSLHVNNFVYNKDSIGGQITRGHFSEKNGFKLDALEGDLLYAYNQAHLKNVLIKTPGSEIKRNVVLEYESYDALVKNFENTLMDVEIVNSYVQVKDILAFAPTLRSHPAFARPNDVWRLNIIGSGNMDRLHFENLQFRGLRNTHLDASGTLAGLTDPNAAGGTFTIRRFHTNQTDISLFTGSRLSTPEVNVPEEFDVRGTLSGNLARLRTNLNVSTSAGAVAVNGIFTNLTNPTKTSYAANIRTNSLRLNQILKGNNDIGAISANLYFDGTGFTPETINTRVRGDIHSFYYNKYNYRNISLNGALRQTTFNVDLDINDPNIDLTATASGQMSANSSFRINGFVDSIKTLPLNFTTEHFVFRGKIDADIASLNPDYLDANILISDALFVSGKERMPIDSLQLISGRTDTGQYIRLTSDIANAYMEGQYRFSELGYIIQNNIDPYFSIAAGNKVHQVQPYNIRFNADISNSPFLSAFVPGVSFVEPLHAEGSLATGQGLNAQITTPGIILQENNISGLNVNVTTTDRGLQFNGSIEHLKSATFNIHRTELQATALNNVIDFNLNVNDINDKDKYVLGGRLTQPATGTYTLHLNPDNLILNYNKWTTSPNNQITFSPNFIRAQNFLLQHGNQKLLIESHERAGETPLLHTHFTNFSLGTITGFMKADTLFADGIINGEISFTNLPKQPLFVGDLTISDLSLQQDTIGNVHLLMRNNPAGQYITTTTISGRGNDIQITGSLTPKTDDVALDLNADIRKLELSTFEGAAAAFVTDMSGRIYGDVKIRGTLSSPDVGGKLHFDDAIFNTVMLGGPFKIDDETVVAVTNKGFEFNQFTIRDSIDNKLTIDGTVATTNLMNYRFDLDVVSDNFHALNTSKKANSLYYGDLVLTTNLQIGGTEAKPTIGGTASINEGTNFTFVLPQAQPGIVEREGVVEFVDFDSHVDDSLFIAYDSLNYSDVTGIDIDAQISISKEAIINMVVDAANGDFVNMKGSGELNAGIDPSGKVTLTGQYEIEEGAYQITFNFLQRKFTIEKGSKIIWLGEPTNAQLDVTAIYVANTAPLDLVGNQITDARQRNYYLQKLPFQVFLMLDGELLNPTITFDIQLPTDRSYAVAGEVVSTVNNRLAQLRQQPGELNKQVFSILLLNRFVGDNPFESSGGGGFHAGSYARASVSKLLTEQLNNLAAGLTESVDINFDVVSSDDYTTGDRRSRTDINVGLSKRLLNDRLTVTVGRNFQVEGPEHSNAPSNNLAGNVAIDYQLTKDGRYMLRFYRRNEFEGRLDGYIIETGLGFSMAVDYDRFREVFQARKIKKEQKKIEKQNADQ